MMTRLRMLRSHHRCPQRHAVQMRWPMNPHTRALAALSAVALLGSGGRANVLAKYDFEFATEPQGRTFSAGSTDTAVNAVASALAVSPAIQPGGTAQLTGIYDDESNYGQSGTGLFHGGLIVNTSSVGTMIELAKYVEFTVTPAAGYGLNLSQLTFDYRRSHTLDIYEVHVRHSLNNFATTIATFTAPADASWGSFTVNLSGADFQGVSEPLTIRLFFADNSASAARSHRIDNLTLEGVAVTGTAWNARIAAYEFEFSPEPQGRTFSAASTDTHASSVASSLTLNTAIQAGGTAQLTGIYDDVSNYGRSGTGSFNGGLIVNTSSVGTTLDTARFAQFGVTTSGVLRLRAIFFDYRRSHTGDTYQLHLRSSVDNYATTIATITSPSDATWERYRIDLSDAAYQELAGGVAFRFYFTDSSTSASRSHRIDNVELFGRVFQPATLVLVR